MNIIESTIKTICEAQGFHYVRSVNINDLNEQVGDIDISAFNGLCVYANTPTIENTTFGMTNTVLMNVSVELYYLKLSSGTDDTGTQVAEILEELQPYCHEMYDVIKKSDMMAINSFIDSYTLAGGESINLSKEVLTGWKMDMVLPIYRNTYYCD